jgi:hypothetical protein
MADERAVLVERGHRLPAGAADHRVGRQAREQLSLMIPGAYGEVAVESQDRVAGADGNFAYHAKHSSPLPIRANRAASANVVRGNT